MAKAELDMVKYDWRILLGTQFATWAFAANFFSPFPQSGILFQSITFLLNKKLALIEVLFEIPFSPISRQVVPFFVSLIWQAPSLFLIKLIATVLILSVFTIVNSLTGLSIVAIVSRFVKRQLRKHSPDIWSMIK